jgi:uncharacterized membrane protein YphA (DoxX/SURF4 family)
MSTLLRRIRRTNRSNAAGICRALLGMLFLSTGVMKFAVPNLREAFSGQLTAAGLPLHDVNMWLVPLVEIGLGGMLLVGFFGRVASLVAIGVMAVATYTHLVVHDPELFPLQPEAPIIPLVAILLCGYVLWAGSGSWSIDLRQRESEPGGSPGE